MYLLDTNVLSELMKTTPDNHVAAWVDQQDTNDLFYSSITRMEIAWGVAQLPNGKRKRQLAMAAEVVFEAFAGHCLDFSCHSSDVYALITAESKAAGRPMSREDGMLAAIAWERGFLLVTRNIGDFEFLGELETINPWLRQT